MMNEEIVKNPAIEEAFETIRMLDVFVQWYTLDEICEIYGGKSALTKAYIEEHPGEFPVYSAQTENDGVYGYINSFDYDGEFITWTMVGKAGVVFHRGGKFSASSGCGILKVKDGFNILPRFLFHYLSEHLWKYVNNEGMMGSMRLDAMKRVRVAVPHPLAQILIVTVLDAMTENFEKMEEGLKQTAKYYEAASEKIFDTLAEYKTDETDENTPQLSA